jgi:hypothetical protein
MESSPKLRVTAQQIRQRFNEARYLERVERGELEQVMRLDEPLSPAACQSKGYPLGTRKQLLEYFDGAVRVAMVHRVMFPNGSIGASGLPDPKLLLVDGVYWYV